MKEFEKVNRYLGTCYISDNDVDWMEISMHKHLSEDFIREFEDKVEWKFIFKYQKISEGLIRDFLNKIHWRSISHYQRLESPFILEFRDKIDWTMASKCQHLSENTIRECKRYVNWAYVSRYQHLSEDFIREFKDKVCWKTISKYQRLSEDFIREFEDKVVKKSVAANWLYKDAEFKKQQVMATGLYECHDDYFIAYKGIRSDRYSKLNFQHKYIPGETYEAWCDGSDEENSFGLAAWTKEKANEYSNELVITVKIRYEDIGYVVRDNGKLRCLKFEVLN